MLCLFYMKVSLQNKALFSQVFALIFCLKYWQFQAYAIHECFDSVILGFVEKEIRKANIPIMDTGENPEVPFPRDMIDLEVNSSSKEARYISFYLNAEIIFLCGWRVEEFLLLLSALSLACEFLVETYYRALS